MFSHEVIPEVLDIDVGDLNLSIKLIRHIACGRYITTLNHHLEPWKNICERLLDKASSLLQSEVYFITSECYIVGENGGVWHTDFDADVWGPSCLQICTPLLCSNENPAVEFLPVRKNERFFAALPELANFVEMRENKVVYQAKDGSRKHCEVVTETLSMKEGYAYIFSTGTPHRTVVESSLRIMLNVTFTRRGTIQRPVLPISDVSIFLGKDSECSRDLQARYEIGQFKNFCSDCSILISKPFYACFCCVRSDGEVIGGYRVCEECKSGKVFCPSNHRLQYLSFDEVVKYVSLHNTGGFANTLFGWKVAWELARHLSIGETQQKK